MIDFSVTPAEHEGEQPSFEVFQPDGATIEYDSTDELWDWIIEAKLNCQRYRDELTDQINQLERERQRVGAEIADLHRLEEQTERYL